MSMNVVSHSEKPKSMWVFQSNILNKRPKHDEISSTTSQCPVIVDEGLGGVLELSCKFLISDCHRPEFLHMIDL
jgi:hypothetical protein